MSIALFHRVCVGAFLLLAAVLWPIDASAQYSKAYDDTWVIRPIFSNGVLPLQAPRLRRSRFGGVLEQDIYYRSNLWINPFLNDAYGNRFYDREYFTRDKFGRLIRTNKSDGYVLRSRLPRRNTRYSNGSTFGNPGTRRYGVHVVDETGRLGLGSRGSGVGSGFRGGSFGGLNVIDNTGRLGVGGGSSGTNGSSSSASTGPVDNVQDAINAILKDINANLNQLRGFDLSDLLRNSCIDFGRLRELGFDFASIYRDPNFDLNRFRELGVIRCGGFVRGGRGSRGGTGGSSGGSGSTGGSTGGSGYGGGQGSGGRFGFRNYTCNNPEEPGDGKIFGPIPDFSFCGVFGPIPTHEELFGNGFEG